MAKNNKKIWIIVGLIVLVLFISNQNKKEAQVCTSTEPNTLEGYDSVDLLALGELGTSCGTQAVEDGYALSCPQSPFENSTSVIMIFGYPNNSSFSCQTALDDYLTNTNCTYSCPQFDYTYKGINIYKEVRCNGGGCIDITDYKIACSRNDKFIIETACTDNPSCTATANTQVMNNYIDTYSTCTDSGSTDTPSKPFYENPIVWVIAGIGIMFFMFLK